jgi:hypothetical protein
LERSGLVFSGALLAFDPVGALAAEFPTLTIQSIYRKPSVCL